MFLFHQAVLESLVRFGMSVVRQPHCAIKNKAQPSDPHCYEGDVKEGAPLASVIYDQSVLRQAQRILTDPSHVLYNEYSLLPFNKSSQTCIFHCI